ncbi:MAG: hypothetical protein KTR14_01645 [Vampirovibrio sp.]|nr:hypothetical protein [Vampirovibrio sp.]
MNSLKKVLLYTLHTLLGVEEPITPVVNSPADSTVPSTPPTDTVMAEFSNAIKLETLNHNLFLSFYMAKFSSESRDLEIMKPQSRVVLENETVKQLLTELADLYHCDVVPRRRVHPVQDIPDPEAFDPHRHEQQLLEAKMRVSAPQE